MFHFALSIIQCVNALNVAPVQHRRDDSNAAVHPLPLLLHAVLQVSEAVLVQRLNTGAAGQ